MDLPFVERQRPLAARMLRSASAATDFIAVSIVAWRAVGTNPAATIDAGNHIAVDVIQTAMAAKLAVPKNGVVWVAEVLPFAEITWAIRVDGARTVAERRAFTTDTSL